ncbi:Protein of unknown function (DUF229) [Popillia japonica]|uniref:Uncharacterized protein n=1 Tax=Popillia japonica TaxID=7064 RepID=A0AAW1J1Z2_POPJA
MALFKIRKKCVILVILSIFILVCNIILITTSEHPQLVQLRETLSRISTLNFKLVEKCFPVRALSVPYEFSSLLRKGPALKCDARQFDWVICEKSICFVKDIILIEEKNVSCTFIEAILTDDGIRDGPLKTDVVTYVLVESDVVRIYCKSDAKTWSSILVGFRDVAPPYPDKTNFSSFLNFRNNVLILGFASVSTNTFVNKLPLTYEYLTKILQGDVIRGYNVVEERSGISTLIPFLRRQSARETYPYTSIWNKFKSKGFVTAYLEDSALWDLFDDSLINWYDQPHHYIKQYYLLTKGKIRSWYPFCSGSEPRHQIWMNYIQNFFTVYESRQKFLFSFQGELSYFNYNKLDVIDEDLLNFLKMLEERKILDNTLLIIMSDKGYKFSSISPTIEMKREELSPFLYFRFPKEFMKLYPSYFQNFQDNINKLVTPYDLHVTLEHILQPIRFSKSDFAISLFDHIPQERSCSEAQIDLGSCGCMIRQTDVNLTSHELQIKIFLESTLNNITQPLRDICATLIILSVTNLIQLIPNTGLSKYSMESNLIIAIATTYPGYTLYEASLAYNKNTRTFSVDPNDIIPVSNEFQRKCAENYTTVHKFCYCKNQNFQ